MRERLLQSQYDDLDTHALQFAEASSLCCPVGCGRCCDHADTEVNPTEASLIASYILTEDHGLKEILRKRIHRDDGECVFYDRDSVLHCRIYKVRPLICRCYGYSAELDKTGALLFPACQHMDLPAGLRAGGGVVRILFEPHPPVMADYRERISGETSEDARMRPLGDAVAACLDL